ncbi:MAG TPA: hypothetical protein VKV02_14255 [Acidobacteriaceae bacterium]|nr:hypothetical protein [Acidobacteriaceae bacterium]
MKLRVLSVLFSLICLPATMVAAPLDPAVPSEPEQFQVAQKTEVPNTTLSPGSYTIRILDHLRDRVILQVSDKTNRVESTFLAIPASTMANAPVGPIRYSTGPKGKAALKGFAFPGGVAVEFVYPKNDAVSIAQANSTRVMAIDPASEGRVAAPKLNQNDMQMITLWMLEPSRVGANDAKSAGITAAKYQAPQTAPPAPVQTAQAEPAPPQAAPAPTTASAPASPSPTSARPARRQRPVQLAQNDVPPAPPVRTHTRPANVTALPHTASDLPLLWLGALVALLVGGALTTRRLVSNT